MLGGKGHSTAMNENESWEKVYVYIVFPSFISHNIGWFYVKIYILMYLCMCEYKVLVLFNGLYINKMEMGRYVIDTLILCGVQVFLLLFLSISQCSRHVCFFLFIFYFKFIWLITKYNLFKKIFWNTRNEHYFIKSIIKKK